MPGQPLLPLDFEEADRLTGLGKKSFIGELMRFHDLHALPQRGGQGLYRPGPCVDTRLMLAMLEKEGLRWEGYIDIFDGGPTVEACPTTCVVFGCRAIAG